MSYAFVQSDRFLGCIRDFQQRDPRYLAELWETVIELGRQPFGNPILQTHRMQGVSGEKRFITDVGGRKGRRLIWSQFNRTFVLLLFGEHDVVERQGERLELVEDPETGGIEIVERTVVDDGVGRCGSRGSACGRAGAALHGLDRCRACRLRLPRPRGPGAASARSRG
jgi:hypothetical protein